MTTNGFGGFGQPGMRIPARRTLQAWAHAARMMHEERA